MGPSFHIGEGEIASGHLVGRGEACVDGRLDGSIDVQGEVRVGPGGRVCGPIRAGRLRVQGVVEGDVNARDEVHVEASGVIAGAVCAPRVSLEDGGRVRGTVRLEVPPEPADWAASPVRLESNEAGPEERSPQSPRLGRTRARIRGGLPILVGLWLVVLGCASPTLTLQPEPRSFTPDDYTKVHDAWTRRAKAFEVSRLSDVLHVSATFESWEFRWAYVIRYAEDYGLEPEARDAMLRATLADARDHHRFFVTLAGERFRESDLTGERSAWRVLLVDDQGHQTVPVEIEKVRKIGPVERVYFPDVNPWRMAFRIEFPATRPDGGPSIPRDADQVTLRFTGAYGQVDLTWELAASS